MILGRRALALFAAAGLGAVGVRASDRPFTSPAIQPEDLPAARDLFARHVEAIGGMEALSKIRNKAITGTMSIPAIGTTAHMEIIAVAPDRLRMTLEIPPRNFVFGYDGTTAWQTNSDGTSYAIIEPQLTAMIEDSDFLGEANWEKRYASFGPVEKAVFNDRAAYVVPATTARGRTIKVYFDVENGLNLGVGVTRKDVEGKDVEVVVKLSGYREIEGTGVMHPMKLVIREGEGHEETRTYTRVRVNVENPPEITAPTNLKLPPGASRDNKTDSGG